MSDLIPSNEGAPHQALLSIRAEVHEQLPTGECSGRPIHKIGEFYLVVKGADRHICIRKLNEILAELKKRCQD